MAKIWWQWCTLNDGSLRYELWWKFTESASTVLCELLLRRIFCLILAKYSAVMDVWEIFVSPSLSLKKQPWLHSNPSTYQMLLRILHAPREVDKTSKRHKLGGIGDVFWIYIIISHYSVRYVLWDHMKLCKSMDELIYDLGHRGITTKLSGRLTIALEVASPFPFEYIYEVNILLVVTFLS